jgi:hypothetical protein
MAVRQTSQLIVYSSTYLYVPVPQSRAISSGRKVYIHILVYVLKKLVRSPLKGDGSELSLRAIAVKKRLSLFIESIASLRPSSSDL